MQQYQWAIEVTMEYLRADGTVEDASTELRETGSEREARARHEAIQDTLTNYANRAHPKYQRLSGSRLLRRPVGEWEEA